SAVAASRGSLMLAQWAERIRTAPISSQVARSAPVTTCSSTGSIVLRAQVDGAGGVGLARPARRDQKRRLVHLNVRRPAQRRVRNRGAPPHAPLEFGVGEGRGP